MYLKMHPFFTHGVEYSEESCTETLLINTNLGPPPLLFFLPGLILLLIKRKSWRWLIITELP